MKLNFDFTIGAKHPNGRCTIQKMYKLKKTCSGVLMVTKMQDASDEDQSGKGDIQD